MSYAYGSSTPTSIITQPMPQPRLFLTQHAAPVVLSYLNTKQSAPTKAIFGYMICSSPYTCYTNAPPRAITQSRPEHELFLIKDVASITIKKGTKKSGWVEKTTVYTYYKHCNQYKVTTFNDNMLIAISGAKKKLPMDLKYAPLKDFDTSQNATSGYVLYGANNQFFTALVSLSFKEYCQEVGLKTRTLQKTS